MRSLWTYNLREFRDRAASADPTPGGGSVAAVAAAEGLALILMSLKVSMRRKDAHAGLKPLIKQGKTLLKKLSVHADEDVKAFEGYMKALRMPKATQKEEEKRKNAIRAAHRIALAAPLRSGEDCVHALELAERAIEIVHAGIASDAGAGAAIIRGALTATLYNVDINLKGMPDGPEKDKALEERIRLERRGEELARAVRDRTLARMRG